MKNGLLLDIDGVLNNYSTDRYGPYSNDSIHQLKESIKNGRYPQDDTWWDHTFEIELSNLQALRVIIKKYSIAKIVICSSWRHVFSLNHLRLLFISKGYPDIANLFHATTDICSKEDKERFKMTKRERTIEIASYLLGFPKSYEGDWFVLDDDVTEDDISTIKDIKHVKSLYFEYKAILQEYRRKESMLIDSLAKEDIAIHPLEKDNENDDELTKEIKSRYKTIKSTLLNPELKLSDMFNTISRELKQLEISALIAGVDKKEKKDGAKR